MPDSGELWELIVKYNGDIYRIEQELDAEVEVMSSEYAIITLPRESIDKIFDYPEVEYVELPKTLAYQMKDSSEKSCITYAQNPMGLNLSGKGTIVAVIDSGIDYRHRDFRNADGSTRIAFLWDQSSGNAPPLGFKGGAEYSGAQINEALNSPDPLAIVPETDDEGHGSCVAGIAAGNGAESSGREKGIAYEATLLIVKMGERGRKSFVRTTELMRALKYCIDKAKELQMPVSVNISYGTNNGSHNGSSLFETFIDDISQQWKSVIVVATGNEAAAAHHFRGSVSRDETLVVEFAVSANLNSLYLTMWKHFTDTFSVELIAPSGVSSGIIKDNVPTTNMNVDGTAIHIFNGQPTHYNVEQEIFIQFDSNSGSISQGLWKLNIRGDAIVEGTFDIWLPTTEEVGTETAFLRPNADCTLTIPSCAERVLSIGGYDSHIQSPAQFSGRGFVRGARLKPDIAAPAVDVVTVKSGGGYDSFSGTSIAAPFVTGSAALMMQWGVILGNDSFLYGERVKAFLEKGAKRASGRVYPDTIWGYGALCLETTMRLLQEYRRLRNFDFAGG